MRGSMWLKSTLLVVTVLFVAVGGYAWARSRPPGAAGPRGRSRPVPRAALHRATTTTQQPPPTTAATTGTTSSTVGTGPPSPAAFTALSQGVTVRGTQLLDRAGAPVRLLGVDVSGTQSDCVSGHAVASAPLDLSEAQAIASWHLNAVGIPLNEDCWLGINGVKPAYSGTAYQDAIEQWVADVNSAGLVAILTLQFAAPGTQLAQTEWPMPDEDHAPTFWSQVATDFAADPGVIFDLYNEPYLGSVDPTLTDWSCWLRGCTTATQPGTSPVDGASVQYQTAGMQQLVDVVRATGARQPIMLSGLFWSGDPCAYLEPALSGAGCPEMRYLPVDPLHQLIIDFHTYLPNSACKTVTCWNGLAAGAQAADLPVVTGEFGERDCSATYMDSYMAWADKHDISYLAWTWDVNNTQQCEVGNGRSNHYLLQNWNGTPSTMSPDGATFRSHIAVLYQQYVQQAAPRP